MTTLKLHIEDLERYLNINIKNRKKYKEYAQLLWNFVYAANYMQSDDKKKLSVYPLIDACFSEYHNIQNITNTWEFDWENVDIENMVHIGDYFIQKRIDNPLSANKDVTYILIKVTDIVGSKTPKGEETKSVRYQTMRLSNYNIVISGKDISNMGWGNYDESMFIKPFCTYIFDGIYKKIDKSLWDEIANTANDISEKYNKCKEIWK